MELQTTLDQLIDAWCERRAIRPLKYLLRAYPSRVTHTDEMFALLDALKDVKGLCREELTPDERQMVSEAHNTLEDALRSNVI